MECQYRHSRSISNKMKGVHIHVNWSPATHIVSSSMHIVSEDPRTNARPAQLLSGPAIAEVSLSMVARGASLTSADIPAIISASHRRTTIAFVNVWEFHVTGKMEWSIQLDLWFVCIVMMQT